jgi:hypothetical protein
MARHISLSRETIVSTSSSFWVSCAIRRVILERGRIFIHEGLLTHVVETLVRRSSAFFVTLSERNNQGLLCFTVPLTESESILQTASKEHSVVFLFNKECDGGRMCVTVSARIVKSTGKTGQQTGDTLGRSLLANGQTVVTTTRRWNCNGDNKV